MVCLRRCLLLWGGSLVLDAAAVLGPVVAVVPYRQRGRGIWIDSVLAALFCSGLFRPHARLDDRSA